MSILASDDFNRANANPLAGNWTTGSGEQDMQLVSNAATFTGGSDASAYYSAITWPNDHYSKAKLFVTGSTGGAAGPIVHVRHSASARTNYGVYADHFATLNVTLGKFVAGTFTTLGTWTQAWTDGDTWEIRAQGTTISIWLNGVQIGSVTDAAISSGSAGIGYSSAETSASIDDWVGGDFAVTALQYRAGRPLAIQQRVG